MPTKDRPIFTDTQQVAKAIVRDIRSRNLGPGDRYLTGADVSKMLGVSVAKAHRALNVLAEENWVERVRPHGTFVGPSAPKRQETRLSSVWILFREGMRDLEYHSGRIFEGIRCGLPGATVQFSVVPVGEAVPCTRQMITLARDCGMDVSFVGSGCTREVYELLYESGLPMLVAGGVYDGQGHIPCVSNDTYEGGRLLTRYLADRGHRRIGAMISRGWYAGDDGMYNGIVNGMTEAGLPPNALVLRPLSDTIEDIGPVVRGLVESEDRCTAIMLTSLEGARRVAKVARELGLSVPADVEVVFAGPNSPEVRRSSFTHVRAAWSPKEEMDQVCRMLSALRQEYGMENRQIVVPMQLYEARQLER